MAGYGLLNALTGAFPTGLQAGRPLWRNNPRWTTSADAVTALAVVFKECGAYGPLSCANASHTKSFAGLTGIEPAIA